MNYLDNKLMFTLALISGNQTSVDIDLTEYDDDDMQGAEYTIGLQAIWEYGFGPIEEFFCTNLGMWYQVCNHI